MLPATFSVAPLFFFLFPLRKRSIYLCARCDVGPGVETVVRSGWLDQMHTHHAFALSINISEYPLSVPFSLAPHTLTHTLNIGTLVRWTDTPFVACSMHEYTINGFRRTHPHVFNWAVLHPLLLWYWPPISGNALWLERCHPSTVPCLHNLNGITKWMFFVLEICKNLNIVLIWSDLFSSSIRIIPFQRPLKFKDLLQKVMEAFGQQMDLYYTDKEVVILVTYCNLFVVKCRYR